MTTKFSTREEWLIEGVKALTPLFTALGETIPTVKVSVGWPGGRGKKNSVIGQCWHPEAAADKAAHIFISPVVSDPVRVLDVLAHELCHAVDVNASGHKGNFARLAKGIGLTGKMTATVAGDDLAETLRGIVADLGDYPHGALVATGDGADGPKKQGTRQLLVLCPETGYKVRMTRKWLEEFGAPKCPCHNEVMQEG